MADKMKVDLIVHNAKQLVTCTSSGIGKKGAEMQDISIVEDGAVAAGGGKVLSVGSSSEILKDFTAETVVDAGKRVVMPAFVDPHTHIIYGGDRLDEFELKIKGADYLEILAGGGGILSTVRHTREASREELTDATLKRLDKMLRHGTATAEIKTGYGLDEETEFKMLDVWSDLEQAHPVSLVPTFLAAHAIPPEFKEDPDGYVGIICRRMLPKLAKWRQEHIQDPEMPFFADVFCEKNAFTAGQTKVILETAKKFGFGLKAHVDEFTNLGGSRLLIEMGAASIDHLDAISDEEIKMLAGSETLGIITPTVNFNFGSSEFADARKLIDSGCAIALSTDYNPGSAPCPSQQTTMQIACRYQKLLPSEAVTAATINAAHSIGLGKMTGSLDAGKRADMLIMDTRDYREICYEFGGNFAEVIIKDGKVLTGFR
ncbi:MAG: imidazolonepropionase [Pyrinomonadaceae bacterium]